MAILFKGQRKCEFINNRELRYHLSLKNHTFPNTTIQVPIFSGKPGKVTVCYWQRSS